MNLSNRDIRILTGLRHGIMDMQDLIDEYFCSNELEQTHDGFQNYLSKQVKQARESLNEKNQQFIAQIQDACELNSGTPAILNEALQEVITKYGKHLGRYSRELLIAISETIQLQGKGEEVTPSILNHCSEAIEAFHQNKMSLRKVALCKKVMRRLEVNHFVKRIVVTSRAGTETYFHLTKNLGKPLVQQILAESGDFGGVVAHNYCSIHAKHDAMVTNVIKGIESFASDQGYRLIGFLSEAEQKSVSMEKRLEKRQMFSQVANRPKKKQFFSDLIVQISCQNRIVNFNIEVDNGTQSIKNMLGKVNAGLPIIILCSTHCRVDFLMSRFTQVGCRSKIFVTTVEQFRQGGLFLSLYRSNLYKKHAHIHVDMLVNN